MRHQKGVKSSLDAALDVVKRAAYSGAQSGSGTGTSARRIGDGKLRPLAVGGAARTALLPNVPTIVEAGFGGFNSIGWSGLVAAKGAPTSIIDKLRTTVSQVVAEPAVRKALRRAGGEPWLTTPAEMMQVME